MKTSESCIFKAKPIVFEILRVRFQGLAIMEEINMSEENKWFRKP